MKNFDEARKIREDADRSFVIGGETFVYRPAVSPEAIVGWTEFAGSADKEQAQLRAAQANLAAAHAQLRADEAEEAAPSALAKTALDIAKKTATVATATAAVEEKQRSEQEWIKVIDETIAAILEPQCHDTWRKVRDPGLAHPLSLTDLQDLMEWLMEQITSRPTGGPSGSSPSRNGTETLSTDESSLREAPAPTPSA